MATVQDKLQIMSNQMRTLQSQVCDLLLKSRTNEKTSTPEVVVPQEKTPSLADLQPIVQQTLQRWERDEARPLLQSLVANEKESLFAREVKPKLERWLDEVEDRLVARVTGRVLAQVALPTMPSASGVGVGVGGGYDFGRASKGIWAMDKQQASDPLSQKVETQSSISVEKKAKQPEASADDHEKMAWTEPADDYTKAKLLLRDFQNNLDNKAHMLEGLRRSSKF